MSFIHGMFKIKEKLQEFVQRKEKESKPKHAVVNAMYAYRHEDARFLSNSGFQFQWS